MEERIGLEEDHQFKNKLLFVLILIVMEERIGFCPHEGQNASG